MVPRPAVAELRVGDAPAAWESLGFVVHAGAVCVGDVAIRPEDPRPPSPGILGWTLRDCATTALDGLPTALTDVPAAAPGMHPNGAVSIDHVVVATPDRARTSAVLDAAGLGLRRVRTEGGTRERPLHQAFHRAGSVIVEVVGPPEPSGDGPATFWGLVCVVEDLDATITAMPGLVGEPRDAVQPGQRIVTVRREAGSSVRLAFLSRASQ